MKKWLFVLAVLSLNVTVLEAQSRRSPRGKRVYHSEGVSQRVDRMTFDMAKTYDLSEEQTFKLSALNRKWIKDNLDKSDAKEKRNRKDCNYDEINNGVTPSVERESRLNLEKERLNSYKKELKNIFTSEQYKAYEERLAKKQENKIRDNLK